MGYLGEVIAYSLKQVFNRAKRIDIDVEPAEGEYPAFEVSTYKVGSIFRVDVKPK